MTMFNSGFHAIEAAVNGTDWRHTAGIKVTPLVLKVCGESANIIRITPAMVIDADVPALHIVRPGSNGLSVPYIGFTKDLSAELRGSPAGYASMLLRGWETPAQIQERVLDLWTVQLNRAWMSAHLELKKAERELAARKYDLAMVCALQKSFK